MAYSAPVSFFLTSLPVEKGSGLSSIYVETAAASYIIIKGKIYEFQGSYA